jgi:hypothetical protein
MMLLGAYAPFTTLGSSEELVNLVADHSLSRGLTLMLGLIGLGGETVIMANSFTGKKQVPN